MVREEILLDGQLFLNLEDWPLMNDYDIAVLIGIHAKDFTFYFESKHQYENEVLELYANQHLLNTKTKLSCCFIPPIHRVKKYLVYLTEEYASKPKMMDRLFSTLKEGIQHRSVSNQFLDQLTNLLDDCLKETFETIRLELKYFESYSQEIIASHLSKLRKMSQEERYAFSQRLDKNYTLLTFPEPDALMHFSNS
jgi:hypothetical protein